MNTSRASADLFRAAPGLKGRVFAFLRFLAFVALSCVFTLAVAVPLLWLSMSRWHVDPSAGVDAALALQVPAEALGALAATLVMVRAGRRRFGDFGFGFGAGGLRHFLVGAATGLVGVALLLLVLRLAGAVSLAPAADSLAEAARHAGFYALLMLGVAFAEECFSRGYALVALAESLSFWPAAVASGALFGLLHTANGGETAIGIASAALFGVVLAYSFRRTGALWFACGVHAGWDFAESFVFGVPNSGITLPGGLMRASLDGPPWLSGGSAGPEGSVLIFAVLGVILLVIRKLPPASAPGGGDAAEVEGVLATDAG